MPSIAEFMAESYRSNTSLIWDAAGTSLATAAFAVDLVKVVVSFERREAAGPWYVSFEVDRGDSTAIAHSAFAIFNGVLQAAEEFLITREPETVIFATKRDELAGIYQTYLRREAETIEKIGYRLEGPIRVDPYTEFMLTRVRPSEWKAD
ncbi:MAG: hypothetical protein M3O20_10205 [Acidobacteriota bacterium]|nr:hypothetical protein [Acidobacteriota bacterium]